MTEQFTFRIHMSPEIQNTEFRIRLQQVTAPSAFASSLTSTVVTRAPTSTQFERARVRGAVEKLVAYAHDVGRRLSSGYTSTSV